MKRKLLSREPLIWFHYALLVFVIFGTHWLSQIIGLESYLMTNKWLGWTLLFIFYYIFLSLGDQLIHYILKVD
jgi:hypothetical protein